MSRKMISVFIAMVLLAVMLIPVAASATTTMYVYSKNGKSVNIRFGPSTDAEILTTAPFGTKVTVIRNLGTGWTEIYWGGNDIFYIQSRFLVKNRPSKPAKKTDTEKASAAATTSITDLNKVFRTFRRVENPYSVTVRAARASGWVNFMFAPSNESDILTVLTDSKQMVVLAEFDGWYQLQDPDTGLVGFMSASFIVK